MDRRARRNLQFLATGMIAAAGGAITALRSAQALHAEPPINTLGGQQRRWRWRENEIFVTELGEGPPVLLVHGMYVGASSYEFRHLAPLLAQKHRVIAMDFLGCGLSDRPKMTYSSELYVNQILDALTEFNLESAILIGSFLGGAFAIRAGARAEGRVRAIAAINPSALDSQDEQHTHLLRQMSEVVMRSPIVGEGLFASLTTSPALRTYLRRFYSDPAFITPDVIEHYEAVTRVPGARYATAALLGGALNCDLTSDLPFLTTPLHVIWGEKSWLGSTASRAGDYTALGNAISSTTYPQSGLMLHEEVPELCANDIFQFLETAGGTSAIGIM
jgi:pimeloyl-ACP methyl ester carboxylesterase